MDLEMTGLDHDHDVIVEIATIVPDDDLALVAEGPDLVLHADAAAPPRLGDVLRNKHHSSGLPAPIRPSPIPPTTPGARTQPCLP